MKKQFSRHSDLTKLRLEFCQYRSNKKQATRYPDSLKEKVVAAARKGLSAPKLAEATGVRRAVVEAWLSQSKKPGFKELVISGFSEKPERRAQVHLRSGIIIELPLEALSCDFILALEKAA